MRAFIASCVAAVILAVVAAVVLNHLDFSSAETFSSANVRL